MPRTFKIEISSRTIIFTFLFFIFLKFLWLIKDLVFSLLIAFIIMSAIKPLVSALERKKIPRVISALIIFISALIFIGYVFSVIIPPMVVETGLLLKNLPLVIKRINPALFQYLDLNSLTQYLPDLTNQIFNIATVAFSNIVFVFSTLFFSLYFVIEEDFIKKLLTQFFEEEKTATVVSIFEKVEKRMSAWFWGQFILMLTVGTLSYIGLRLIGIRYALPLAVIAGLLEIIPNLGPIISTIPAALIALGSSYFLVFSVIALYFIVQQLENNLIVPLIMRKAVGLHPIITLMAIIVGGKIGGVIGVLLSIPATLFIDTVLMELIKNKKRTEVV